MNVIERFQRFQSQDAIEHLERVRWHGTPECPYCGSGRVGRRSSADRKGDRWQCHDCSRSFSATVGTIFHGTHVPLRDWFLLIALTVGIEAPLSASQIARDLSMRRATVLSLRQRISAAIADDGAQAELLRGIISSESGGNPDVDRKAIDRAPQIEPPDTNKRPRRQPLKRKIMAEGTLRNLLSISSLMHADRHPILVQI